ncbi:hypothetical protein bpr_II367 (plasmid) [Butyrivibrio proteoclasticus B316]|uniref:Uncharacterized protein n=1 Tax=Butyrivibrio proteoclasticus (strain ATCC 51982 / DSM 14932 / B316) TaxID=515622 RepID=E0S4H2_BUTPB|nr:hypothetical protein [Butyrivibrio proteoclasticus]ADL36304.1 hypothetical protein bpr_II367 [Butyrivibrio proteoclasticus B316]
MKFAFQDQVSFTDTKSFDKYVASWRIERMKYIVFFIGGIRKVEIPADVEKRTRELVSLGYPVYQFSEDGYKNLLAEDNAATVAEKANKVIFAM